VRLCVSNRAPIQNVTYTHKLIQELSRPDTGFLVFLCFQETTEMVLKLHVATACFSCNPPKLDALELTPNCESQQIVFRNFNIHH
jgi:hypothetical protein